MIRNPVGQAKPLKKKPQQNKLTTTKKPEPGNILNTVKVSHSETEISEKLNSKVKL